VLHPDKAQKIREALVPADLPPDPLLQCFEHDILRFNYNFVALQDLNEIFFAQQTDKFRQTQ
jgi:hypothetical protein